MGKKLLVASAAAVGGMLAVGNWMLNTALKRKPQPDTTLPDTEENRALDNWFCSNAKRVTRTTYDKYRLCAWFIHREGNHRYAIVCHGYGCCGKSMRHRAKVFYDMGFSILLPDARAHGGSSGDMIGMGWPERRDIVDWIYDIIKFDKDAEIILFGESMGAATVMMTAGEVLPDNVKLVIEDCGYTDVEEELTYEMKKRYNLPKFPLMNVTSLLCRIRTGHSFKHASAVEQLRRCRIPMLFLHGECDDVVPYSMVFKLYAAMNGEKEMVTFPEAGHCRCAETDSELYWGSIRRFIDKHMSAEPDTEVE